MGLLTHKKRGDVLTANDYNRIIDILNSFIRSICADAILDTTGLHIRKKPAITTETMFIAEVATVATGGGYYNCYLQTLDATDWDTTESDQLDNLGGESATTVVVLNLDEIGSSNHALSAGDIIYCARFIDDEGNARYAGTSAFTGQIFYGKPTGAFSSGATITLDPCDTHGTDNGHANITAYVQPSQASYSMTNSTTIPVTAICPYVLGTDGSYYLLGTPIEIVTDVDVTSTVMTKKTRNVWILTVGTESAAVTIDTFTTSCP